MKNIVLAGFMGTGKSSVGREIALRLGRRFVDTDEMVTGAAGATVAEIFASAGEAAFRRLERRAVSEAASLRGEVIAVGGGALLDAENRAALEATGLLVCLDADEDELLARLGQAEGRPLLAGDATDRMRVLRAARAEHYASIPWRIDTTGRTVAEVAEAVALRCAHPSGDSGREQATEIRVSVPSAEYTVRIGSGILGDAGQSLLAVGLKGAVAAVAQPMPRALYWPALRRALREFGIPCHIVEIPDGEAHKTLATVSQLYDAFAGVGLDRSATVVALGGGVTGDLAGFAAATYLRGLAFVQIPTTLLAMVDSSVGGKTGVDLPAGKNLVGAFHQPRAVICDVDTLATLPDDELRSGLAEAVKTALLGDAHLFDAIESAATAGTRWPLAEVVARCIRVKARVVAADPEERGLRAVLNLGHTIGHGVEQASGYRYRHGEAVSIGLVGAARLAAAMGRCDRAFADRVEALLIRIGLPATYESLEPEAVLAAMQSDKKRRDGTLRWVLPLAPGQAIVTDDVPAEAVGAVVAGLAADHASATSTGARQCTDGGREC